MKRERERERERERGAGRLAGRQTPRHPERYTDPQRQRYPRQTEERERKKKNEKKQKRNETHTKTQINTHKEKLVPISLHLEEVLGVLLGFLLVDRGALVPLALKEGQQEVREATARVSLHCRVQVLAVGCGAFITTAEYTQGLSLIHI